MTDYRRPGQRETEADDIRPDDPAWMRRNTLEVASRDPFARIERAIRRWFELRAYRKGLREMGKLEEAVDAESSSPKPNK